MSASVPLERGHKHEDDHPHVLLGSATVPLLLPHPHEVNLEASQRSDILSPRKDITYRKHPDPQPAIQT